MMRGCGSAGSFIVECRNTSAGYMKVHDIIMGEFGHARLVAMQSGLDIGRLHIAQTSLLLAKRKKKFITYFRINQNMLICKEKYTKKP